MSGLDRKQTLRIDCNACRGNGFKSTPTGEETCSACEGSGQLTKEVDFKFHTGGKWEKEEIAEAFGIPVDQVKDDGHDAPSLNG